MRCQRRADNVSCHVAPNRPAQALRKESHRWINLLPLTDLSSDYARWKFELVLLALGEASNQVAGATYRAMLLDGARQT